MPSMKALQVLVAISERGSTTAAAEAIHLSQSAVSRQLLLLEEQLGTQVFTRSLAGMVPTEIGKIYIEQARVAMRAMEDAALRAAGLQADPRMLRLKVLPVLGDRWLLARLEDFTRKHPEIDVRYTTLSIDSATGQPDCAFRFGRGQFPNEEASYLFGRDVKLVCTPGYLAGLERADTLEGLAQGTVFEHRDTPLYWSDLVAWHGRPDLRPRKVTRIDYYTLVLRAAISGHGLALVPAQLVEGELASGQLVNPAGLGYEAQDSYWFTVPTDRKASAALTAFRCWLEDQVRRSVVAGP
jgi:DNA-binding transcriptional LysR family regulator